MPRSNLNEMSIIANLYKEYRCLWDPNDENYDSYDKKKDCWKEIGKQLNLDYIYVRNKVRYMTAMFNSEWKKYNESKKSDGSSDYYPSWYLFEHMKFLLDVNWRPPCYKRNKSTKKLKPNKLPLRLLNFFGKLYCQRANKGIDGPKRSYAEATKAYTTLSPAEKEKIAKMYEMCKLKKKKKQADYLDKKTKPYLKKKNLEGLLQEKSTQDEITAVNISNHDVIEDIDNEEDVHLALHDTSHNIENDPPVNVNNLNSATECSMDTSQIQTQLNEHSKEKYTGILLEPTPPTLRNGRELFNMIHSNRGDNMAWQSLTKLQKSYYGRAVSRLKSIYILKFKAYLESLPSQDLFNYYTNYF